MKPFIAALTITLALASPARAQERIGDAALGALSGGLVFGPVGLVAGAVVGFTAGPTIARSWRANRHQPRPNAKAVKRLRMWRRASRNLARLLRARARRGDAGAGSCRSARTGVRVSASQLPGLSVPISFAMPSFTARQPVSHSLGKRTVTSALSMRRS